MFVLGRHGHHLLHDHLLQTVLDLLLPLHCLLNALCTQTVRSSAGLKIEETTIICFLWCSRGNTRRLTDSFHLTEVYRPLAVEVLSGVVIPELVLDSVQHKPSLLPSF